MGNYHIICSNNEEHYSVNKIIPYFKMQKIIKEEKCEKCGANLRQKFYAPQILYCTGGFHTVDYKSKLDAYDDSVEVDIFKEMDN